MSKFFRCIVCAALVLNNTLLLFPALHSSAAAPETQAQRLLGNGGDYDLDHVVVTYKNNPKKPKLLPVSASVASSVTIETAANHDYKIVLDKHQRLEDKINQLLSDPNVAAVQPQYIYKTEAWTRVSTKDTPSDFDTNGGSPLAGNHWYYEKEHLREMWQDQDCFNAGAGCGGNQNVIVAVIDTGLAYENRGPNAWSYTFTKNDDMFAASNIHIWQNTAEINGNAAVNCSDGVDDDGDGYVDDCYGANTDDFINCTVLSFCDGPTTAEEGHPNDDGGHGTFVTGLISSLVDNALYSVSPAPNVTIMPLKASFQGQGSFGSLQLIEAINYAVAHGAKVINMSLAGPTFDSGFNTAVQNAVNAGVTVIAASGNTNSAVSYPAAFDNVIAVGAINATGSRAFYSNFGANLDLVAYVGNGTSGPGDAIYQRSYACFFVNPSCYTTNNYSSFSTQYGIGTSYASPQVVALAALMLSAKPNITRAALQAKLFANTTDVNTAGFDNDTGNGAINYEAAYGAVANNVAPTVTITEPNGVSDTPDTSFNITWTDADPDDSATINLYYDNNNSGFDGTAIEDCANLSEDSATNNCALDTRGFPAGTFYIYGCIYDNVNNTSANPTCSYSSGAMTVSHALKRDLGINSVTTAFSTVNFATSFDAVPMLFVQDCSENGADKVYVNVKNVTTTNFQVQLAENVKSGFDNVHPPEAFCWYATQSYNADEKVGATNLTSSWKTITFPTAFGSTPKVFTMITSENGTDLAYTDVKNVTTTSFDMRVEETPGNDQVHTTEKANWIAFTDLPAAQEGTASTDQNWSTVTFGSPYTATPVLITDVQSENGPDPVNVDIRNLNKNGFDFRIEEDPKALDGIHTSETINWAAITYATVNSAQGLNSVNGTWTPVVFPTTFADVPKIFASIDTQNGADTDQPDIKDVTNKGFSLRVEEDLKGGYDGVHTNENIIWYAVTNPLASEQSGFLFIDNNWVTINFPTPFVGDPNNVKVFAQSNSKFGSDTILAQVKNVTLTSFDLRIVENTKLGYDGSHMKELVSWMVFNTATPPLGVTSQAGTANANEAGFTAPCTPVTFPTPFAGTPKLLVNMDSVFGTDESQVDICTLTNTGFSIRAEEQPKGGFFDGLHMNEKFVWYAWP